MARYTSKWKADQRTYAARVAVLVADGLAKEQAEQLAKAEHAARVKRRVVKAQQVA